MTSLWLDRAAPVEDDPLPGSGEPVDALVVGAGLTGLTTSLLLARAGRRVACVEARDVGAVTTGRTTGKVSLLQGTHLSRIRRHQSEEVAAAYVDANREGMEWLLRFCDDHAVPYQRRTAVTYAADEQERSSVEQEHRAASALGLAVEWRDTLDVPFPHVAATTLADQAQFDSMDVLAALVEQLRAHGGTLHQGHRVRSVSKGGRPTVRLEGGETLTADHLVLATGTPILDRGLHFSRLEPQRSYVLALDGAGPRRGCTSPPGPTPGRCATRPAARSSSAAPVTWWVVPDSDLAHLDRLRAWAAKWYPATTETHHWSAQDYSSPDGVPYVGLLRRGGDRIYVATGYEKWGMTNGVVAARAISSDILGDDAAVGADPQRPDAVGVQRRRDRADQPRDRRRGRCRSRAHRPRAAARQRRTGPGQPVRHRRRLHPPRRSAEVERRREDLGLPAARLPLLARRRGARGPRDQAAPQTRERGRGGRRPGGLMSKIRRVLILVAATLLLAGCG